MKKLFLTMALFGLSGCASMFNGSTQSFSVSTSNDKAQELTRCNIANEEGSWQVPPNQTTTIHRDGNLMTISCDNTYQSGTNSIDSKFDGGYLLLDLLTGYGLVIGIPLDSANNAFYSYPGFVSVAMQDKPGIVIPTKKVPILIDTPTIENNININNYPGAGGGQESTVVEQGGNSYYLGSNGKCYTFTKSGKRVPVDKSLCN